MTSQPPPDPYHPASPPGGYGAPPPGYGAPPPPPPPPGYGYGYGYPPPPGTNTMAILSLVFAFIFSPLAIVFGHMAKKQIRATGEEGDGLATAGLVMGYIFTGLTVFFCCGYLIVVVGMFGLLGGASSSL